MVCVIGHGDKVYAGMVVGEHSRSDLRRSMSSKSKQLTNVRASGADEAVILVPPKKMTLEEMMSYIDDDDGTNAPKGLRLRKEVPRFQRARSCKQSSQKGRRSLKEKPAEMAGFL